MKVKDAMHKGTVWVGPNATLPELAKKMRDNDIGALPVGENDRLIGMVTDRDIVVRALANGRDPDTLTARDVMTPGIEYCRASDELHAAIKKMEEKRIRRLTVLDDNKRLIGMLSLGDVSRSAAKEDVAEMAQAVSAHHG